MNMGRAALTSAQKAHHRRIGTRIAFARRDAGLRYQRELADRLRVSTQTINDWERGRHAVPAARLPDLASALGVTVSFLTGESGDKSTESVEQRALRLGEKLGVRLMDDLLAIPLRPLRMLLASAVADYHARQERPES